MRHSIQTTQCYFGFFFGWSRFMGTGFASMH